jgi:conjugal transfer pilus assembly protein TraW
MPSRKIAWIATALFLSYLCPAFATPEIIGPVHHVVEPDMVEWLKSRAATFFTEEKLAAMEAEKTEAMRHYVNHPPGVSLPRTVEPATRMYDPTITVPYDLRDHEGHLIHAAGTRVNPLSMRSLTRKLLFFNADDKEQVQWAKALAEKEAWKVKPIATAGSPVAVGEAWKKEVTFDQQGVLVSKLGITHVPAVVFQEGELLRVDEVVP